MEALRYYYQIIRYNFKLLRIPAAISLAYTLLTPVFYSFKLQNENYVYGFAEVFLSVLGILLYSQLSIIERENMTEEISYPRKVSQVMILAFRLLTAVIINIILSSALLYYAYYQGADFNYFKCLTGSLVSSFFFGSLVVLTSSVLKIRGSGLFFAFFIYIINFLGGDKLLGRFYIFTMLNNHFEKKGIILIVSLLMICTSGIYYYRKA